MGVTAVGRSGPFVGRLTGLTASTAGSTRLLARARRRSEVNPWTRATGALNRLRDRRVSAYMRLTSLTRLSGLLGIGALSASVAAQPSTTFDPFAGTNSAAYHFDLDRNFFSSRSVEAVARTHLLRTLQRLGTTAPTATRSAPELLKALQLQDSVRSRWASAWPTGRSVR